MTTSYDTLTVGQYERIQAIQRADNDINRRNLAILSILTGQSEEELLDLPIPKFRALMDKASFLRRRLYPAAVSKAYKLGNMTLRVTGDIRKMTAAQYIDFQTFAKQPEECAAELLSCFLVPDGHRYNTGYDILDVQRAIRELLPVPAAQGLLAFFLRKFRQSTVSTLRSSAKVLRREAKKRGEPKMAEAARKIALSIHSPIDGGGLPMSTPLVK